MRFVVVPNSLSELERYEEKKVNTFILGLEDYCVNYPSVSLEKIKELSKKYSLFIAINKNIFNSELDDIKKKLLELANLPIMGVMFYDLGILNIVIDNKINIPLVWHQTHMVTNYNTCNFYYDKGVEYGYLANEITLEEMIEIKNKTKMKLLVECFGYPIMSHSRRSLVTNYFKSIDSNKEDRNYTLSDNENNYIIKENNSGTSILFGKVINGTRPLFDLITNNFSFGVLDMQNIEIDTGLEVLDKFNYIKDNIDTISDKEKDDIIIYMNNLIGDSTNFFYKKTIYKVKKGDK